MVVDQDINANVTHAPPPRRAYIGNSTTNWHWTSTYGFDLTHSSTPGQHADPRLLLETTTSTITVAPPKTALLIIDMQNFFLSPAFGRPSSSPGHTACNNLLQYAIPAARKAGIQVIWVNWGLTPADLDTMPPGVTRAFGFQTVLDGPDEEVDAYNKDKPHATPADKLGRATRKAYGGLGTRCGRVKDRGTSVDAGDLLVRGAWNAELYAPLAAEYERGKKAKLPDLWVHKNRMSGLWGGKSELQAVLEEKGIKSLLFTGVNTDQCVGGTLMDAVCLGYDCVMLEDGCGTTSLEAAQTAWKYNAGNTFGFEMSCEKFANGVERMDDTYVVVT